MANPQADLGALAVRRLSVGPDAPELRLPRRWFSRVLLPASLLAGFAVLVAWAAWDSISPPLAITVAPVVVATTTVDETAGQELFKANGWIEPRPLPVDVPVETDGMYRVAEVCVNPGDPVKAGQLLVRLDDARAKLDRDTAQTRCAKCAAAVDSARADVAKAEVALANATANIDLIRAETDAEVKALEPDVAKAEAVLLTSEFQLELQEKLQKSGTTTTDLELRTARKQRDSDRADVQSVKARLAKAKVVATVRVRQAELIKAAAAADLKSLQAKVEEAAQEFANASVEVQRAHLEFDRTRIVAPMDGVVMQLNVRVGTMMGGRNPAIDRKDAVVTLYDPKKLQVRVEVPIGKFQFVHNGQPAVIEIEDVLPGQKLIGTVLYDTHQANVARNSVPVKVALPDNLPEHLRPEMIASVRFQAPAASGKAKTESARRLIVRRRLLQIDGESVRVWVVDRIRNRAELRTVELWPGEKDRQSETAEVVGGLQPTDQLIASGLDRVKAGSRVRVVGEER